MAIEVKNGKTLHPKDFHGLETFKKDYPLVTPIILYRGIHRYKQRGILCCPVDGFLLEIYPDLPLPESQKKEDASILKNT